MINNLYGYPVIVSPGATEEVLKISKRLWKERLFTLPFKPFKKLKSFYYQRPCMYMVFDQLLVHPALVPKLRELAEC